MSDFRTIKEAASHLLGLEPLLHRLTTTQQSLLKAFTAHTQEDSYFIGIVTPETIEGVRTNLRRILYEAQSQSPEALQAAQFLITAVWDSWRHRFASGNTERTNTGLHHLVAESSQYTNGPKLLASMREWMLDRGIRFLGLKPHLGWVMLTLAPESEADFPKEAFLEALNGWIQAGFYRIAVLAANNEESVVEYATRQGKWMHSVVSEIEAVQGILTAAIAISTDPEARTGMPLSAHETSLDFDENKGIATLNLFPNSPGHYYLTDSDLFRQPKALAAALGRYGDLNGVDLSLQPGARMLTDKISGPILAFDSDRKIIFRSTERLIRQRLFRNIFPFFSRRGYVEIAFSYQDKDRSCQAFVFLPFLSRVEPEETAEKLSRYFSHEALFSELHVIYGQKPDGTVVNDHFRRNGIHGNFRLESQDGTVPPNPISEHYFPLNTIGILPAESRSPRAFGEGGQAIADRLNNLLPPDPLLPPEAHPVLATRILAAGRHLSVELDPNYSCPENIYLGVFTDPLILKNYPDLEELSLISGKTLKLSVRFNSGAFSKVYVSTYIDPRSLDQQGVLRDAKFDFTDEVTGFLKDDLVDRVALAPSPGGIQAVLTLNYDPHGENDPREHHTMTGSELLVSVSGRRFRLAAPFLKEIFFQGPKGKDAYRFRWKLLTPDDYGMIRLNPLAKREDHQDALKHREWLTELTDTVRSGSHPVQSIIQERSLTLDSSSFINEDYLPDLDDPATFENCAKSAIAHGFKWRIEDPGKPTTYWEPKWEEIRLERASDDTLNVYVQVPLHGKNPYALIEAPRRHYPDLFAPLFGLESRPIRAIRIYSRTLPWSEPVLERSFIRRKFNFPDQLPWSSFVEEPSPENGNSEQARIETMLPEALKKAIDKNYAAEKIDSPSPNELHIRISGGLVRLLAQQDDPQLFKWVSSLLSRIFSPIPPYQNGITLIDDSPGGVQARFRMEAGEYVYDSISDPNPIRPLPGGRPDTPRPQAGGPSTGSAILLRRPGTKSRARILSPMRRTRRIISQTGVALSQPSAALMAHGQHTVRRLKSRRMMAAKSVGEKAGSRPAPQRSGRARVKRANRVAARPSIRR